MNYGVDHRFLSYARVGKLAAFLWSWQQGLKTAGERTASVIRSLDLADIAQVERLLLSAEGEPIGSYLVDVFDRVLQHEIEREAGIIEAAVVVNSIKSHAYPPPYVAGSRDLQDLVQRSLFQNRERLRLVGSQSKVAFGDMLRRRKRPAGVPPLRTEALHADLTDDSVLLVLTPACDLQRGNAKRVLCLVGTLNALGSADWRYAEDPIRTPVVETSNGDRFWIRWDLSHIETVSHTQLDELLSDATGYEVIGRLRESPTLELQQKLLAGLGRVGQLATMPATFPMKVALWVPNSERKLIQLKVEVLEKTDAVCYVGRPGEKDMRLVVSEDACEAACDALASFDIARVHPDAVAAVKYLRETDELRMLLDKGVTLPSPAQQDFKDIPSPSGTMTSGGSPRIRPVGLILRRELVPETELSAGHVRKAGIVISAVEVPRVSGVGPTANADQDTP